MPPAGRIYRRSRALLNCFHDLRFANSAVNTRPESCWKYCEILSTAPETSQVFCSRETVRVHEENYFRQEKVHGLRDRVIVQVFPGEYPQRLENAPENRYLEITREQLCQKILLFSGKFHRAVRRQTSFARFRFATRNHEPCGSTENNVYFAAMRQTPPEFPMYV